MSGYRFDRFKILVVDDNVHMRKLVTTILQAFGVIQIYEAENSDRAWNILREANPDVVVMDWMIEGMSGIDLARKVLADDPQRWVVLCSGYEMGDYPASWGANVRTLLKPFEIEELEELLVNLRQSLDRSAA